MAVIPLQTLEETLRSDGRYRPDAFAFLLRGIEHTSLALHGDRRGRGPRHVSGRQLCDGLRELAIESWGPLAALVLERWGVRCTRDFGEMVYFLIGLGLLGRQESDRIEDFDDVYTFEQSFGSYHIPLDSHDDSI